MYSLYLHIPFCRQACHYCDFHFSTTLKRKPQLVNALCKELELRKTEAIMPLQTIYLGGGTPSVLSFGELSTLFSTIHQNYSIAPDAEITIEVNPDDFTSHSELSLAQIKSLGINRLSVGVQSFFEEDLRLMNRIHTANQAIAFLEEATNLFENITLDLIYGIPNMSNERWIKNIEKALSFGIPHLSAYALTVEHKTALYNFIKKGKIPPTNDLQAREQFYLLKELLESEGFIHYELSNFGKKGYFSRNNTAYWQQKKYMGIGPSAHSYNGTERYWNIPHNIKYIEQISKGILPQEKELLSKKDLYNERIMTGLRIQKGISLSDIEKDFGSHYSNYLKKEALPYIEKGLLLLENDHILTSKEGLFLSDGIASDLFILD
ncbi:MAG: radical SAM family heme chaperone HemW [Capnocytophaga sp.]|nr:MAG: radical SAM family heme chaperone HemW [Capnocytophaga sp.]